MKVSSG